MSLYKWSQLASADGTADPSVNWQENQAPSTVNDAGRGMMAAIAKYRDDIAGGILTSGAPNAYTVSSNQAFVTFASLANQMLAFTPHATNSATVTLNVDGLGARPLRSAPSVELPAGVLVQGTPYVAIYNNSDAAFYLHGFYTNPYQIPIGGSIDYWGTSAPNSSFALMYGQAISRTAYLTLFNLFSTTYGSGDGLTTFNIPDLRGRVVAGKDDMGGSAQSRLTTAGGGVDGITLGAVGGSQNVTLSLGQIPSLPSSGNNTITVSGSAFKRAIDNGASLASGSIPVFSFTTAYGLETVTSSGINSINVAYTNSSQAVTKTVMPTIIGNKILRLI